MVSSVHGTVRSASRCPPQTSTTVSPATSTNTDPPSSSPASSCAPNASATPAKRSPYLPWRALLAAPSVAVRRSHHAAGADTRVVLDPAGPPAGQGGAGDG